MRYFILLFSVILFTVSCADQAANPRLVNEVERLQLTVDSAEMIFLSWNLDSLSKANKAIKSRVDEVVQIISKRDIMLNMDDANVMADFKSSGKAFKKMNLKMPRIMEEISYSRTQLSSLKHELETNAQDMQTLNDFLAQEGKAAHTLLQSVRDMDESFEASRARVNVLGPRVDVLLDNIKQ